MSAYYNEIDPYAAQWLRNLIAAGLIAPGDVDTRSIVDVKPDDLTGYTQCHFFAGIGGWSLAARLAGWPDERPLWTGSCPCQPFSVAGRRKGIADERHLWPDFYRLIRASRPAVVMGEQTAGAPGYAWLDGVLSDLEAEAYAGRAVDIPACSVNSPQIRNRLYWLACTDRTRLEGRQSERGDTCGQRAAAERGRSADGGMAGSYERRGSCSGRGGTRMDRAVEEGGDAPGMLPAPADDGPHRRLDRTASSRRDEAGREALAAVRNGARRGELERRGGDGGPRGLGRAGSSERRPDAKGRRHVDDGQDAGREEAAGGSELASAAGFWDDWVLIGPDPDGKYRRIKPGIAPLDTRLPGHVGQIRGYGNAICPELAAEVIRAYMESNPAAAMMPAEVVEEGARRDDE